MKKIPRVIGVYKRHEKRTFVSRLAEELGIPVFGQHHGQLPSVPGLVYNFGYSEDFPLLESQDWINNPLSIRNASLKTRTFKKLAESGVPALRSTTDPDEAYAWAMERGERVFCRHLIQVSQGRGIEIWDPNNKFDAAIGIPEAKLYTMEFVKNFEFRVHAHAKVGAFYTQIKVRDIDALPVWDIRSATKGWKLIPLDGTNLSPAYWGLDVEQLNQLGLDAVRAVGLDLGAVDILVKANMSRGPRHPKIELAVVCEVNSGPALRKHAARPVYAKLLSGEYGEI